MTNKEIEKQIHRLSFLLEKLLYKAYTAPEIFDLQKEFEHFYSDYKRLMDFNVQHGEKFKL